MCLRVMNELILGKAKLLREKKRDDARHLLEA